MAQTRITIDAIGDHARKQVEKLVKESGVYLRNRLIELSPVGEVNGGTFKSNWQFKHDGLTYTAFNTTQGYAEAITFGGSAMPPSWQGKFRSRFGLPERWPEKLAAKETGEQIPRFWSNIVRRG